MTSLPSSDGAGLSALAQPLELPCGLSLPNRILKSAMAEGLADRVSGDPGPGLDRLYRRWAGGGAGTLITGLCIVRRGSSEPNLVVIDERSDLDRLAAWAEAAHGGGARVLVQIGHQGRQVPSFVAPHPVAPSALPGVKVSHLFGSSRALSGPEVRDLVERFAVAAQIVERAGFDGVQLHAAHGYLIGQFLSPVTNHRTDEWGGDLAGRSRFLIEIVRAVRARVGARFAVTVKLNASDFRPGGFDIDDSTHVAGRLGDLGVDLIEISGGTYESASGCLGVQPGQDGTTPDAYFAGFAPRLRAITGVPLALTGGLRTRTVMDQLIADGVVDAIGLARPLVQEPDLPHRLLDGSCDVVHLSSTPNGSGLFEFSWYMAQFRRLAAGGDFDPDYPIHRVQLEYLISAAAQYAALGAGGILHTAQAAMTAAKNRI